VVAVVSLLTCGVLIWHGHNGFIAGLLATIIGYYFGKRQAVKND